MVLEREQAPCQLIPVCPRCYDFDLCRAIYFYQSRRLLLGPERLVAQLTNLPCTTAAKYRVFHFTADTLDGNQHSQKVDQGHLHCGDDTAGSSLIRGKASSPVRFKRTKVRVDILQGLPWTEP